MRAAGNIKTGILRHASKFNATFAVRTLHVHWGRTSVSDTARPQALLFKLYPVEYGALTQLWAGTMPEALEHNGEVRSIAFPATPHVCDSSIAHSTSSRGLASQIAPGQKRTMTGCARGFGIGWNRRSAGSRYRTRMHRLVAAATLLRVS